MLIVKKDTNKIYRATVNDEMISFINSELRSGIKRDKFKMYNGDSLRGVHGMLVEYKIYTADTTYRYLDYGSNLPPHLLHASIALYELSRKNDLTEIDSTNKIKYFQDVEAPSIYYYPNYGKK